ncbi:MAG: adenylate/guanylate cyclase domain-containing protein [Panacibacter sp.]
MPQSRQLAAIMFTDIVGYTALMGEDEQKAFEILRKNRLLQKPLIEKHNGKWVKEIGDGVLASFYTVTDAVACAQEIQKACNNANNFKLRIGIHLGEIVFEDGDIFGDGVNIAARIQALAPIGGIWISESVYNNIANKKDINVKFAGEEILKNVKDPIKIYDINIQSTNSGEADYLSDKNRFMKITPKKSIAVLPFINMSNDPEQEYFSDGITEEILNSLVHLNDLKVAGRTSSFQFKGKNVDLKEVGEKLHVNTVLEGSVRKQGNRVRVTAQLINAEDGYHLWGERYDRDMNDIFEIQDEIAGRIANHLKVTFFDTYEPKGENKITENMEAYEMILRGRYWREKHIAGFEKALRYFQNAVSLDPLLADAWCYMGEINFELAIFLILPFKKGFEIAKSCIKKALEINPQYSDAHLMLATLYFIYDRDLKKSSSEFNMAVRYSHQNYTSKYPHMEAWYRCMLLGQMEDGITIMKNYVKHDPDAAPYLLHLGYLNLHGSRNYEDSRKAFLKVLELDPMHPEPYRQMALCDLFEKKYELAEKNIRKAFEVIDGKGYTNGYLIIVLAAIGKVDEAQKLYDQNQSSKLLSPVIHAEINAYLNRTDKAFEWLEKAFEECDFALITLKYSPEWDFLRHDPRFQEILERMNFPE